MLVLVAHACLATEPLLCGYPHVHEAAPCGCYHAWDTVGELLPHSVESLCTGAGITAGGHRGSGQTYLVCVSHTATAPLQFVSNLFLICRWLQTAVHSCATVIQHA